jgi:hypothetical protein
MSPDTANLENSSYPLWLTTTEGTRSVTVATKGPFDDYIQVRVTDRNDLVKLSMKFPTMLMHDATNNLDYIILNALELILYYKKED